MGDLWLTRPVGVDQGREGAVVEKPKSVIHEGNVRRIVVRNEGRVVAEFPPTDRGCRARVLALVVAAIAALAALLKDCTIEAERTGAGIAATMRRARARGASGPSLEGKTCAKASLIATHGGRKRAPPRCNDSRLSEPEIAALPGARSNPRRAGSGKSGGNVVAFFPIMRTREHLHAVAAPAFSGREAPVPSTMLDRWALRRIQQNVALAAVRFRLWDGFELSPRNGPAVATIVIKNRPALLSWVWDPELNFGEAYMFGAVEVRGDLVKLLEEVYRAMPDARPRAWWMRGHSNGVSVARENVHCHYDLGNEFYQRWLDREMVYTCAHFPTPAATLEEAQISKMDRVCRKLRLTPGERVVEAGCGWGAMALFMAERYGVTVRAFNLSGEQIAFARERAAAKGPAAASIRRRRLPQRPGPLRRVRLGRHARASGLPDFDARRRHRSRYRQRARAAALHRPQPPLPLTAWTRKRVFPGAYPPALREVCEHVLERPGFSVIDVENLRLHYALTLEHWYRRFNESSTEVAQMFDETFVRAWRLYLAGSQAAFTTGSMQLFQVVFARGASNAIPWTRDSTAG